MLSIAGYIGLFIMLLGIILTVVGIVYYELQISSNKPIAWWVWLLLSLGFVMTIIGMIVTFIFLRHPPAPKPEPIYVYSDQLNG